MNLCIPVFFSVLHTQESMISDKPQHNALITDHCAILKIIGFLIGSKHHHWYRWRCRPIPLDIAHFTRFVFLCPQLLIMLKIVHAYCVPTSEQHMGIPYVGLIVASFPVPLAGGVSSLVS